MLFPAVFSEVLLGAWNQLWWECLHHGNRHMLHIRAFFFYFRGLVVKHLPAYWCAHMCAQTHTHTLPQCGLLICFLARITSPMFQHHVSRKTLSCIKILWYMHHSQLKFLIKTLISLLRQVEKLLDITVFRFLPQLSFRDSIERFVLSSSVISDSLWPHGL